MTQGSKGAGALELLGKVIISFEPKISLELKKKKTTPEFPKCLHHIISSSEPIVMLLNSLDQRRKKNTASLGKVVAKQDGVGEGGCVTTSPHPIL